MCGPEKVEDRVEVCKGGWDLVRRLQRVVCGVVFEVIDIASACLREGCFDDGEGDGDRKPQTDTSPEGSRCNRGFGGVLEERDANCAGGQKDEEGIYDVVVPDENGQCFAKHFLISRSMRVIASFYRDRHEGLQEHPYKALQDKQTTEAEEVGLVGDGGVSTRQELGDRVTNS